MTKNVTLVIPDASTGADKPVGTSGTPLQVSASTTVPATLTDRSFAVSNTSQVAMPANTNRKGWKIKNDTSEPVWICFVGTAVAAPGTGRIRIAAGGYIESQALPAVETAAMTIIHGATVIAAGTTAPVTIYEFG